MSETQREKKSRWLPLESNPQVMNDYIYKLGVSRAWAYTDVWGLDSDLLSMISQPVKAVLLLFPITENYERDSKEEVKQIQEKGQDVSPNVIFYKQTISNACGTIGLLHSLASNTDAIPINDGPLKSLLDKTKNLTSDERAKVLEKDQELAEAHKSSASSGQTIYYKQTPREDEVVNLHFATFIEKDGSIYQLDGRKPFPINHGPCKNLLEDSAKIIKKFMERDPENYQFTVIALTPNQD
ncbi:16334_t:CDS:2 [Funneliformis geosporum]|uniref:Ubiquitin carboxyl-terminal hydrolase n=1 Tax=Funneliformis geosporum TaxID=1117311 RepID=A0A9W4SJN8_9GLOM|nr:11223_t:CDS:2 [Funneliformis geosporum]CAI2172994.1 16334_t:CDS:2 [Funneliformis geosporum]